MDDLLKPRPDITEESRTYVYDRLLFDTDYSFEGYQEALREVGFIIVEAHDLSEHLRKSYAYLSAAAGQVKGKDVEKFQHLSFAYQKMVEAIERGDLGWGMYLARK